MCLLRPGQTDAQCGHVECKNFYLLSKQSCLYNTNISKVQNDSSSQTSENQLNHSQMSLFSLNRASAFTSKASPTDNKRPMTTKSDISTDLEAELDTQSKKVKTEGNNFNVRDQFPPLNTFIQATMSTNNSNIDNQSGSMLLGNNLLGNLRQVQNPQNQNQMNNPQLIFPLLHNMQSNSFTNSQVPVNFSNLQFGSNQASLQSFPQPNYGNQDNIPRFIKNTETNCPLSNGFEEAFKEVETRTLGLLATQTKMLNDLAEKNNLVHDTLACLISEINTLKKSIFSNVPEKPSIASTNQNSTQQIINSNNETITSEDLLTYLYGNNTNFEYQIVLDRDLELPLYRERNFGFTAHLVDQLGKKIENVNKISLTISIYTCENPPKYIDINTAGNKILKGFAEKDLSRGAVSFDKIQIKEVTSHFRNGWIFFVIHPKASANSNVFNEGNGAFIDIQKIRPLILEKVIVKAKKMKEKEETASNI